MHAVHLQHPSATGCAHARSHSLALFRLHPPLARPIPNSQGTESKWNWSECWDEILKQEELDREKLKGMEVRASRRLVV